MSSRGRLYQDESFEVAGLTSCIVEQLVVYMDPDRDNVPQIVLLKPADRLWQRFFLDAGLGFWGEWEEEELDLEDLPFDDIGLRLGLVGAQILGAAGVSDGPEFASRIVLHLSSGRFELRPTKPRELESDSEVIYIPEGESRG